MAEEVRDDGVDARAGEEELTAAEGEVGRRQARLPVPFDLQLESALRALRAGKGTERDQEVVFKRLYPALMVLFGNRGCRPEEAEDLTLEVLERVFTNMEEFRSEGAAIWSWVKSIGMNHLSNHIRERETLKRGADRIVPLERERADGDEDVATRIVTRVEASEPPAALDGMLAEERRLRLRDALEQLPQGMREVVALRLGGLSYEDVAENLGVKLNTVRSQLHAATRRLRRILAASFPELGDGEEP